MQIEVGVEYKGSKILDILDGDGGWGGRKVRLLCKCGKRFVRGKANISKCNHVSCDNCRLERNRKLLINANNYNPRHQQFKIPDNVKIRHCRKCFKTKDVDQFEKGRNRCKECRNREDRLKRKERRSLGVF